MKLSIKDESIDIGGIRQRNKKAERWRDTDLIHLSKASQIQVLHHSWVTNS